MFRSVAQGYCRYNRLVSSRLFIIVWSADLRVEMCEALLPLRSSLVSGTILFRSKLRASSPHRAAGFESVAMLDRCGCCLLCSCVVVCLGSRAVCMPPPCVLLLCVSELPSFADFAFADDCVRGFALTCCIVLDSHFVPSTIPKRL